MSKYTPALYGITEDVDSTLKRYHNFAFNRRDCEESLNDDTKGELYRHVLKTLLDYMEQSDDVVVGAKIKTNDGKEAGDILWQSGGYFQVRWLGDVGSFGKRVRWNDPKKPKTYDAAIEIFFSTPHIGADYQKENCTVEPIYGVIFDYYKWKGQPTEHRFKVGDKVKYVGEKRGWQTAKGAIWTIVKAYTKKGAHLYTASNEKAGTLTDFTESDFEAATPDEIANAPQLLTPSELAAKRMAEINRSMYHKYKVGDKVRFQKYTFKDGRQFYVGTIVDIDYTINQYIIQDEKDSGIKYHVNEAEIDELLDEYEKRAKQLKLLKLKAKAAKAKLALMQLDGFDLGMAVHHNSPYLLKRADGSFVDPETGERLGFDHRFMGKGEGHQAHGWGTYVSEKDLPNYAESYINRNTYRGKTINEISDEDLPRPLSEAIYNVLDELEKPNRTPAGIIEEGKEFCTREIAYIKEQDKAASKIANIGDDSIDYAHNEAEKEKLCNEIWNKIGDTTAGRDVAGHIGIDLYYGTPYSELIASWRDCFKRQIEDYKEERKAYESFDPNDFERHEKERHHYIVEIPDNNGWNYIEADFDLTQEQIQKILDGWKYIADYSYMGMALELPTNDKGKLFAYDFGKVWEGATLYHWLRDRFEGENDTERAMHASKFLHRCGFVGIHYFGHWRDGSSYVIFDEADAKITSHNLFGLGEADEEAMKKCCKAIERSKRKIANWKAEWKIAKEVAAAEEQRGIKERLAAISAKADAIVGEKLTRENYNKLNPADKKKIDELNEEYTNVQQEYSKTIDRPYDLLEKINAEERKVSDQEATLNRLMKEYAAQPAAPDNKTKLLKLKAKAAKAKLELMKISDEPKYKVGDRFLDKRTIVGYNPKKGWIYQITQVGFNNAKGKWIYLADLMNGRAINKIHGHGKMFYDEDLDSFAKLSDSDKMDGINDFEERHALYLKLLNDSNYYDVMFNPENGGLKAVHYGHNFDKRCGKYERHVMEAGFSAGHCVVLEDETNGDFKQRFIEGYWNGLPFEVAGRETATENNVFRGLKHCAGKRKTKIAVLYYPKGFDLLILRKAIGRYIGLKNVQDGNQFVRFERIICIQDGQIVFEGTI